MKNLRLIPGFHKQEAVIKVAFTYDNELIPLVKAQKGVRWSQTLKSWYFPKKEFQLHAFYQALKGNVFIDYSQLKQTSPPIKKTTSVNLKPCLNLPKEYSEQLILKRYSPNTIKTYSSCFLKFLLFFKNVSIDTLTKNDIKRFLLYLIEKEKASASTQNQYISAIKFYYEKVLKQQKMDFTIERPKKGSLLPHVLSKEEVYGLLSKVKNLLNFFVNSFKVPFCFFFIEGIYFGNDGIKSTNRFVNQNFAF